MEQHAFNSGKFPVADQVIYYFNKILFNHIDADFWIAGGALTSFMSKDKIKDIDCFVSSRHNACKLVLELRRKFEFKHYLITKEAIKGTAVVNGGRLAIDVVKRSFDSPKETIEGFDFTVCCMSVDRENLYYHKNVAFDILRKKLVVNNLPFPVSSVRRMNKYIKKGYSACNGTIMEVLTAVRGVGDEDFGLVEFYPID